MKRVAVGLGVTMILALAVITVVVEREGTYLLQTLSQGSAKGRALVLYHPSRDARFSDDLSRAFAQGLIEAGLAVDLATLTSSTPARPEGYTLIAVVSNTYYWTPDLPTLHYLRRAHLEGRTVVGLIGGAGATGRSRRVFDRALRATGGIVWQTRSFWLWRPNDETRLNEPNRQVALDLAKQLGKEAGTRAVAASPASP
jgi:hypothetical protein